MLHMSLNLNNFSENLGRWVFRKNDRVRTAMRSVLRGVL